MCPTDVNHFVPLLELKLTDLKQIAKQATAERMVVPKENRIYYFSTKLEVSVTNGTNKETRGEIRSNNCS